MTPPSCNPARERIATIANLLRRWHAGGPQPLHPRRRLD